MGHSYDNAMLVNEALKVDHDFAKICHVTYVTKVSIPLHAYLDNIQLDMHLISYTLACLYIF